ncbi:MAG: hypothetical protein O3A63_16035 [Proteobacteria bacterium]|nr:hypothetical protein [Pseudomonadota bacterium]
MTVSGLLACPTCDTQLGRVDDGYHCKTCRIDYPRLADLPWLFSEPGSALADWRNRWQYAISDLLSRAEAQRSAIVDAPIAETTERLTLTAEGLETQAEHLRSILAPLDVVQPVAKETYLALRSRLPTAMGLLSYSTNLHRDWCWGDEENRLALEQIRPFIDPDRDQTIVVLGAGGARLAYDLHAITTGKTLALDANPLYGLLAHRLWQGDEQKFVEFPLAPKTSADCAIEQVLRAPGPAREGLHYILGDVLRPPLMAGSFDVIVTPWLLDVLPTPAGTLLRLINHLLTDNGIWINHGSVAFANRNPLHNLTFTELLKTAQASGFEVDGTSERRMPYLASPHSRFARQELTTTICCHKSANVARPDRHQHLPEWIVHPKKPVPVTPEFRTQLTTTRINAHIMGLIDGARSIRQIAEVLQTQRLMPAKDA